ncbi:MAG: 30S ribosomal protein S20 [Lentisphaeria bacterium]
MSEIEQYLRLRTRKLSGDDHPHIDFYFTKFFTIKFKVNIMANNKSRIKTIKKVKELTLRNKSKKSAAKTFEKNFIAQCTTGDKESAEKALATVISKLDKMAKTNTIHKGKADRKKSRLTLAFNKAFAN